MKMSAVKKYEDIVITYNNIYPFFLVLVEWNCML